MPAVTEVFKGATVHDQVTVTGPTSGTVSFVWYDNAVCSGDRLDETGAIKLSTGTTVDDVTVVDATGFPQTPASAGSYAFRARYNGNKTYDAKWSACEPLSVIVDEG